jgi:alginate O-acetyltransferase complex protein AlgI
MIAPFEVFMLILGLTVPIFWLIPAQFFGARAFLIIGISAVFLFSLNPVLILTIFLYLLWTAALWKLYSRGVLSKERLRFWSWSCFVPLAIPIFVPGSMIVANMLGPDAAQIPALTQWTYLGLSYTAIRGFLVLREGIRAGEFRFGPAVLSMAFFGSYLSGPLAGPDKYTPNLIANHLSLHNAILGVSRIGWGLALLLIIAPVLANYAQSLPNNIHGLWAAMYLKQLRMFLDFSGYSDAAIGVALLYGINLPENFRQPWRARSVQEYWQRWHISFTSLVSMYVFKPVLRATGKPAFSIFAAFLLVGLWHQLSWTYLVWGFGHGIALALQMRISRQAQPRQNSGFPVWVKDVLGWSITMTYVSFLSAFANSPSLNAAIAMAAALIGLGR